MEPEKEPEKELYAIYVPKSPDRHVFTKLAEVRKFLNSDLGKQQGTRFKKCVDEDEVDAFLTERSAEEESMDPSTSSRSFEPVSPYKSPPIARFTEFRKAIEKNDDKRFEELLDENPGFLVNTNNDRPNIIQAGFHYNALHVACRSSNYYAVKRILELVCDSSWLTRVYGTDSCAEERSTYLLDAFLNTPDMAENNTPLHYACKFGSLPIVSELLKHSVCRRRPKNKYDETPLDMLCRGVKGPSTDKRVMAQKLSARLSPLRSSKPSREEEVVVTEVPCEVAHEGLMMQRLGIVSRVGGWNLFCYLVLFCFFVFLVVGNIRANVHSRIFVTDTDIFQIYSMMKWTQTG